MTVLRNISITSEKFTSNEQDQDKVRRFCKEYLGKINLVEQPEKLWGVYKILFSGYNKFRE